ncbi:hypothetical protein V5F53_02220 [Xanthobacter sp. V4C-4]|uniref:hypothetical protein n=1 Tax=Xanthobacter cornucopiae TaxID=3119924 RepID=UPI003726B1DC
MDGAAATLGRRQFLKVMAGGAAGISGTALGFAPTAAQAEVFRLPSSCCAEENGAIVNSGRRMQWHYAGQEPSFEARHDGRILRSIMMELRRLYGAEGGACPEQLLRMTWDEHTCHDPYDLHAEEVANEANGTARSPTTPPRASSRATASAWATATTFPMWPRPMR